MVIRNPETLKKARAQAIIYTQRWREKQDPAYFKASKRLWMAKPLNRLKHTLGMAKRRAKSSGREFSISIDDLLPLPTHCPVLGIEINYNGTQARGFVNNSPSIDRIDHTLGYIPGNVRIICWRANRIKADASIKELEAILRYMKGNGK